MVCVYTVLFVLLVEPVRIINLSVGAVGDGVGVGIVDGVSVEDGWAEIKVVEDKLPMDMVSKLVISFADNDGHHGCGRHGFVFGLRSWFVNFVRRGEMERCYLLSVYGTVGFCECCEVSWCC